ncbi:hydrogen peroxide-inducible genes activator [Sulfitobacter sp. S190]|uniref:hydrogen peroxide-inducible genes activator n=1 Tax=Sulfitobacter sp. S190 TaxID=2867022 RepID=UPI0021A649AE|nr:hydrogen peroxide-inducible genes activator [Sulfitobacter sp. S190]UWR21853.1 hydrogen peroxide-inducible genes activator [Sulfitobacter sp. S190]
MDRLTIKQLRYFEAVAEHGNFGRAAEACGISQPAISVQIRELETSLGHTLFERGTRTISLTSFGQEIATRARIILMAIDDLSEMGRASQTGLAGKLRLGVIPTIAPYLLPQIILDLTEQHAQLDLQIRETLTEKLIAEIKGGQLDAAIVALPISEPGLIETPLFDETFLFVRPLGDADKPVPGAQDLAKMRLLLLEEGHCFREQALSFCTMPTARPKDGMDGSSLSTLVQMVGAGIGVTLIPQMAAPVEARSAPVCVTQFKGKQPRRSVGLVWRRSSPMTAQFKTLADLIRTAGQRMLSET